ncbi:hypothetical protein QFZ36_000496 [Pseudarthrobacter siccitolerans]|uniref:Tape measure domain protein n=1 Tax=Pseudarthrobacter siccitolerans TaxID=861266 RepID=A0ABU0PG56_9MICC|nr:hypothetical protein [Pseudarthrobacter siccitolerans]MDQ0672935.1 hypothetical protein [Pseudarthrobacter siccitolerans]
MAASELQIVVRAIDEASATLNKVRGELNRTGSEFDGVSAQSSKSSTAIDGFKNNVLPLAAVAAGAGAAVHQLAGFMGQSIDSANRLQSGLTGLSSVARAFGHDADAAKRAAQNLAKDGLMTVAESATGLKNLLAAGFSLPESIKLMERFKDSAAFGRQASLGFGQAVASATEGIKNGNSILVDNAGVTKNLSMMLEEAGYSAQDLMKASSDAGVRQAIFGGIVKETTAQLGDADRLTRQFAGSQAQAAAQTEVLKQQIGTALQTALLPLLQAVTPIIVSLAGWVQEHQRLTGTILIAGGVFLAMIAVLGSIAAIVGVVIIAFGAAAAATAAAVGIGIAAVVGLAVAVALNMDRVKGAIASVPNFIRDNWAQVGGLLLGPFLGPLNTILGLINQVMNAFGGIKGVQSGISSAGKALKIPGFATGGFTGQGGADEVAGIVHKGEYVVPRSQVDQSTGLPLMGGGGITINNTNHIYSPIDMDEANARLAWGLANA